MSQVKYRFYRRCHVCSHISKDNLEIMQCHHCQKHFSKFFFCEDLHQFIKAESLNELEVGARKAQPLVGISFVWKSKMN